MDPRRGGKNSGCGVTARPTGAGGDARSPPGQQWRTHPFHPGRRRSNPWRWCPSGVAAPRRHQRRRRGHIGPSLPPYPQRSGALARRISIRAGAARSTTAKDLHSSTRSSEGYRAGTGERRTTPPPLSLVQSVMLSEKILSNYVCNKPGLVMFLLQLECLVRALEQDIENLQTKLGGCLRENQNLQEEVRNLLQLTELRANLLSYMVLHYHRFLTLT